jgi:hypothetical protein
MSNVRRRRNAASSSPLRDDGVQKASPHQPHSRRALVGYPTHQPRSSPCTRASAGVRCCHRCGLCSGWPRGRQGNIGRLPDCWRAASAMPRQGSLWVGRRRTVRLPGWMEGSLVQSRIGRRGRVLRCLCLESKRMNAARAGAPPNPSIERTPYGTLRVPPVAAHVER